MPIPEKRKIAVSIISPGDGKKPHAGVGTTIVDLETGQEIENVTEVHIHIVPNAVVSAEIILHPALVSIGGAEATIKVGDKKQ